MIRNTPAAAAPPSSATTNGPGVPLHQVLIIGLMLLQLWTAAGMAGTPDTLRDLYFAQQIATGQQWPLNGPVIYNTLHLGPLWYYLLGAGMWLVPHPLTVPVLTAAIAALKFPLAYAIGRRYGGDRLGLLFALAFFIPGWTSFILAAMTHTTVVETAVLFGLWSALRYRDRPDVGSAALLGAAATAMFHAHPTTLLIGTLLVIYATAAARSLTLRLRDLAIVAAIGLVSLTPMLLEQVQSGFSDLHSISSYGRRDPAIPSPARVGAMLLSLAGYGAEYTLRYWLETPAPLRRALMLLHLAALGTCALLAATAPARERRRLAVVLLVLLPLQSAFVLALRPITPFWMIFAHLPLIAALIALGLDRLCELGRAPRMAAVSLLVVWSGWSLAIHRVLAYPPEQALVSTEPPENHGLMNVIRRTTNGERHTILLLAMRDRYAITEPLCAPTTLYSHYAEFIDQSLGTGLLVRCGRSDQIRIGGPPLDRALIGLRDYAWRALSAEPQHRIAHLGYSPVRRVLRAGSPSPPAVPGMFPAHPDLPSNPVDFAVRGDSAGDEFVAVTHRAAFHEPFRVQAATADGKPIEPLYRDHITAIYRAPGNGAATVAWNIPVHASPEHVDVVTFADAGQRDHGMPDRHASAHTADR